ncbi:putative PDF receptor-like [Apostichopus japonicus]|uniref:Putative PDF receptor-like n=1 Tax=Stichopus japonicus TaxID=307972 RepID=A0A2G8JE27_STIJA|nr:putative PDF receptor-like [Apostichopus japonicus]
MCVPLTVDAQAHRRCGPDGFWEQHVYEDCSQIGPPGTVPPGYTEDDLKFYSKVINGAKILEVIGITMSLMAVLVALYIFHSFRSLRNHRTRIHQHLFLAFLIRLTLDVIFMINRFKKKASDSLEPVGINKFPPLVKVMELCREYARLCTFTWMFVEGIYLNSLLSTAVFRKPNFLWYYLIGWASPIPFVLAFCIAMQKTSSNGYWHIYTESNYYVFFIEGPRNIIVVMNVFLLLNIIRVLITKLRESQTSETKQVRKATKACIVLLPLLGTANLVWIPKVPEPGKSSRFYFASYYYVVLFLDAYQGFFLALLYCFLNIDVRVTIKRKWQGWMNARNPYRAHGSVVTTTTDVRMSSLDNNDSEWGGK